MCDRRPDFSRALAPLSCRVRVAKDKRNSRDLVEFCLHGPRLECRIDGSGFDAVKLALADDFNVLLMEMEMPAVDGFEAVRVLRECGCARPIIALTAHQGGLEVERAGREGCSSILRKPVTIEKLHEVLEPLLAGRGISRVTATQH